MARASRSRGEPVSVRTMERGAHSHPSLLGFLERLARLLSAVPAALKELLRWFSETLQDLCRRLRGGGEACGGPRRAVKVAVVG